MIQPVSRPSESPSAAPAGRTSGNRALRRPSQFGASLLEFSLIITVFLVFLLGIVEISALAISFSRLGRALHEAVEHTARQSQDCEQQAELKLRSSAVALGVAQAMNELRIETRRLTAPDGRERREVVLELEADLLCSTCGLLFGARQPFFGSRFSAAAALEQEIDCSGVIGLRG